MFPAIFKLKNFLKKLFHVIATISHINLQTKLLQGITDKIVNTVETIHTGNKVNKYK